MRPRPRVPAGLRQAAANCVASTAYRCCCSTESAKVLRPEQRPKHTHTSSALAGSIFPPAASRPRDPTTREQASAGGENMGNACCGAPPPEPSSQTRGLDPDAGKFTATDAAEVGMVGVVTAEAAGLNVGDATLDAAAAAGGAAADGATAVGGAASAAVNSEAAGSAFGVLGDAAGAVAGVAGDAVDAVVEVAQDTGEAVVDAAVAVKDMIMD